MGRPVFLLSPLSLHLSPVETPYLNSDYIAYTRRTHKVWVNAINRELGTLIQLLILEKTENLELCHKTIQYRAVPLRLWKEVQLKILKCTIKCVIKNKHGSTISPSVCEIICSCQLADEYCNFDRKNILIVKPQFNGKNAMIISFCI